MGIKNYCYRIFTLLCFMLFSWLNFRKFASSSFIFFSEIEARIMFQCTLAGSVFFKIRLEIMNSVIHRKILLEEEIWNKKTIFLLVPFWFSRRWNLPNFWLLKSYDAHRRHNKNGERFAKQYQPKNNIDTAYSCISLRLINAWWQF